MLCPCILPVSPHARVTVGVCASEPDNVTDARRVCASTSSAEFGDLRVECGEVMLRPGFVLVFAILLLLCVLAFGFVVTVECLLPGWLP